MPLDYPLWLRTAHFFNVLLLSLLVRSGLEILSAHPRFYWNDHCTPGSEWLKLTKKQRPKGQLWATRKVLSRPPLPCRATKIWVSDDTGTFSRTSPVGLHASR